MGLCFKMYGGSKVKKGLLVLIAVLFTFNKIYAAQLHIDVLDAVRLFKQNSRINRIYQNEREAKAHLIDKAKSTRLPSLELDISYNLLNEEPKSKTPFGNLPIEQSKFLKGQLVLSHLIYDFGIRESYIERALLDTELTGLFLNKELNDGALGVTMVFNQLVLAKKVLAVYEEELKLLTEQKKRIDGFFEEGLVTRNDVLQVNVEISNTKQKILSIQNDIDNLKEKLKTMLNVTDDIEVKDTELDDSLLVKDKAIYEKRPEILIAQKLVVLKELELKAVEADNYPKFYALAGVNYEENEYRISNQYLFMSVGLKVNLFDGKKNVSEKLSLLKSKQEYEEKVRQAKDLVKLDVIQAMNDVKTAINKIDVAKEAILEAKENLSIEEGRYAEQLVTATDLIAATLRVSRANLNYYEAVTGYKNAYFRLLWSKGELYKLGKGLKDE